MLGTYRGFLWGLKKKGGFLFYVVSVSVVVSVFSLFGGQGVECRKWCMGTW